MKFICIWAIVLLASAPLCFRRLKQWPVHSLPDWTINLPNCEVSNCNEKIPVNSNFKDDAFAILHPLKTSIAAHSDFNSDNSWAAWFCRGHATHSFDYLCQATQRNSMQCHTVKLNARPRHSAHWVVCAGERHVCGGIQTNLTLTLTLIGMCVGEFKLN